MMRISRPVRGSVYAVSAPTFANPCGTVAARRLRSRNGVRTVRTATAPAGCGGRRCGRL